MSKTISLMLMAAIAAMSFLTPASSLAQTVPPKPFSPKIKTPNTSAELRTKDVAKEVDDEKDEAPERDAKVQVNSGSPRRLQQHGLGFGLGQTFLLGDYGKYGNDKIALDFLYSYAASYSFDLLVNAHVSEHRDNDERMKVMGLTSSIKGRFVEYDNLSPFFLGGLGFYAPQAKRDGKWSDQRVTFGLNFGGGVDLRLNDHYVVGVMGQMHWPFKVEQENMSDLKGYYFKLLITGMYLF